MTSTRVPVLMYHKVGAMIGGAPDTFINISPASFRLHLEFLQRRGYRAITFAQAVKGIAGEAVLPRRCYAVTFDDGYSCVGEHAAPTLERIGAPATVFVVSEGAGASNAWDEANGLPVLPLMGWDELRALNNTGWEIGGHTRSHPHLSRLSNADALDEIRSGAAQIREKLGCTVQTFCYPYGDYGRETPDLVREAGFRAACTTRSGIASAQYNAYLLPRVKIAYRDGVAGLMYKMYIRPLLPTLRRKRGA